MKLLAAGIVFLHAVKILASENQNSALDSIEKVCENGDVEAVKEAIEALYEDQGTLAAIINADVMSYCNMDSGKFDTLKTEPPILVFLLALLTRFISFLGTLDNILEEREETLNALAFFVASLKGDESRPLLMAYYYQAMFTFESIEIHSQVILCLDYYGFHPFDLALVAYKLPPPVLLSFTNYLIDRSYEGPAFLEPALALLLRITKNHRKLDFSKVKHLYLRVLNLAHGCCVDENLLETIPRQVARDAEVQEMISNIYWFDHTVLQNFLENPSADSLGEFVHLRSRPVYVIQSAESFDILSRASPKGLELLKNYFPHVWDVFNNLYKQGYRFRNSYTTLLQLATEFKYEHPNSKSNITNS